MFLEEFQHRYARSLAQNIKNSAFKLQIELTVCGKFFKFFTGNAIKNFMQGV